MSELSARALRPSPSKAIVHRLSPGIGRARQPNVGLCGYSLGAGRVGKYAQRRLRASLELEIGGGGQDNSGGGESGGGGGGGGDDSADEEEPDSGSFLWKGWQERVQADPDFAMKVLIEQIIGVGAAVLGDMAGRPNWGLNELDFVFSTLVVGSILNFSLMYLLAATPKAAAGAAGGSIIQKLFSEQTLKSMGAPGGHMFEPGFNFAMRTVNLAYKGVIFALVGTFAGFIGTSASNGLLYMRRKFDPNFELQNEVPNIVYNSLTWGVHMGLSSNVRYQALYGLDMVLSPALPSKLFLVYSAVVRTVNNMVGGMSFVFFAKMFGVQKSAEEPDQDASTPKLAKKKA